MDGVAHYLALRSRVRIACCGRRCCCCCLLLLLLVSVLLSLQGVLLSDLLLLKQELLLLLLLLRSWEADQGRAGQDVSSEHCAAEGESWQSVLC